MYKIKTLNRISPGGLKQLDSEKYEVSDNIISPDAILVRSTSMHDFDFNSELKAIARAGAGVNNIPIDQCTQHGVVVFNTPGANANAVKELVIASMLLVTRHIAPALHWVQTIKAEGDQVPQLVENHKSQFLGSEIKGKKLMVIGLGAIGVLVANTALELGMQVVGYDPYISVDSAWGLSRNVARAKNLETVLGQCDYITLHVPFSENTKQFIDKQKFSLMKNDTVLLNFSRSGLVDNQALLEKLNKGLKAYVTDFPEAELLGVPGVVPIPHLGASTQESEDNCSTMAAKQLCEFLEHGNIDNSVNFPACHLPRSSKNRLVFANDNIPNIIGQIATFLAKHKVNITDMLNKSRDQIAYNLVDIEGNLSDQELNALREIKGVMTDRLISNKNFHMQNL